MRAILARRVPRTPNGCRPGRSGRLGGINCGSYAYSVTIVQLSPRRHREGQATGDSCSLLLATRDSFNTHSHPFNRHLRHLFTCRHDTRVPNIHSHNLYSSDSISSPTLILATNERASEHKAHNRILSPNTSLPSRPPGLSPVHPPIWLSRFQPLIPHS